MVREREDVTDPLAVTDRDMRKAVAWMYEHGLRGIEPTPLLAARLRARRRIGWAMFGVAAVLFGLAMVLMFVLAGPDIQSAGWVPLSVWTSVIPLVALIKWLRHRAMLLADRRLGAELVRRVAHAATPGWRKAMGLPGLLAVAVTYGGSLTLVVAAALNADPTQGLLMIALLLPSFAVMAGMTAFEVSYTLGRPALADDPVSLAVDDALRVKDVRQAAADGLPLISAIYSVSALEPYVLGRFSGLYLAVLIAVFAAQMASLYSGRSRRSTAGQAPTAS